MSLQVYFEDGQGNIVDESGNEPFDMEIDEESFPLNTVTDYNQYVNLKPPERELNVKEEMEGKTLQAESSEGNGTGHKHYKKYSDNEKELFFFWCTRKP